MNEKAQIKTKSRTVTVAPHCINWGVNGSWKQAAALGLVFGAAYVVHRYYKERIPLPLCCQSSSAGRPKCSVPLSRLRQWKNKSIVGIADVSFSEMQDIFSLAKDMQSFPRSQLCALANGYVLSLLFFEASTRTRCSFECAMLRLGGGVSVMAAMATQSSAKKGETLGDTLRTVSQYSDLIAMRHPLEGAAKTALRAATVPLLNAGDGTGEHPTQALLDVFTMIKCTAKHAIEGMSIALIGDLKNGRTVHSLLQALALFKNVRCFLVSPPSLQIPSELMSALKQKEKHSANGLRLQVSDALDDDILRMADVLYVTRVQKERFADAREYEKVKGCFRIDGSVLSKCKAEAVIMHPLPRVGEIAEECDADERAKYFVQVNCGMHVRMAIIALTLGLFLPGQ